MRSLLGPRLTLRIDPRKVSLHYKRSADELRGAPAGLGRLEKLTRSTMFLFYRRMFVLPGDWDLQTGRIEQHTKSQLMLDLIANRDDIRSSRWCRMLTARLAKDGMVAHKEKIVMRSEADIENFMQNYVLRLVQAFERDGYDDRQAEDIGLAMITRDGRIVKTAHGEHRFYLARGLGVAPVPIEIECVHREWFESVGASMSGGGLEILAAALKQVEAEHR